MSFSHFIIGFHCYAKNLVLVIYNHGNNQQGRSLCFVFSFFKNHSKLQMLQSQLGNINCFILTLLCGSHCGMRHMTSFQAPSIALQSTHLSLVQFISSLKQGPQTIRTYQSTRLASWVCFNLRLFLLIKKLKKNYYFQNKLNQIDKFELRVFLGTIYNV